MYDATARQKSQIAKLCIKLGIRDHLEDQRMTYEEAGRLIENLKHRFRYVGPAKSTRVSRRYVR